MIVGRRSAEHRGVGDGRSAKGADAGGTRIRCCPGLQKQGTRVSQGQGRTRGRLNVTLSHDCRAASNWAGAALRGVCGMRGVRGMCVRVFLYSVPCRRLGIPYGASGVKMFSVHRGRRAAEGVVGMQQRGTAEQSQRNVRMGVEVGQQALTAKSA